MKFFKLKTVVSLLLAGMLAISGCIPASAAAHPLSHSHRWEKEWWYEEADEWFHVEEDSKTPAYPNADVFEAEKYTFYYPASSAEIRHDGHGEFWVEDAMGTITSDTGATAVIRPDVVTVTEQIPAYPGSWQGESGAGIFTPPSAILQNGGILGTLRFLGNTVTVYEGTSNSSMAKGAGHFTGTSVWNGNSCFAGHNRGANAWFRDVKDLKNGDIITYSTSLGTRTYRVTSIRIVSVNDFTPLSGSSQNMLTLVTCLANEPDVRLIAQAVEI